MPSRRIGTVSASSLVRSATAAYNKTQEYNDSIKAYEYDRSDKTAEDLAAYTTYIKKRQGETTDPSKILTFQKMGESAYKSHRSSEIGKANLAINYGSGSLYDKKALLERQFGEANAIGDQALMQTIELQRSNVDIQIQNQEAAAASKAAAGAATAMANTKKQYAAVDDAIDLDMKKVQAAFKTNGKVEVQNMDGDGNLTDGTHEVRVTETNRDEIIRNYMMSKRTNMENHIKATGDEDGSIQKSLDNFIYSGAYTASGAHGKVTKESIGTKGKAQEWDSATSSYKDFKMNERQDAPPTPVTNPDGSPVFVANPDGSPSEERLMAPSYKLGFEGTPTTKASQQFAGGGGLTFVDKDAEGNKVQVHAHFSTDEAGRVYITKRENGQDVKYYVKENKRDSGETYVQFSKTPIGNTATPTSAAGLVAKLNEDVAENVKLFGDAGKFFGGIVDGAEHTIGERKANFTERASKGAVDALGWGIKSSMNLAKNVNGGIDGVTGVMNNWNNTRIEKERTAELARQAAEKASRELAARSLQATQVKASAVNTAIASPAYKAATPAAQAKTFLASSSKNGNLATAMNLVERTIAANGGKAPAPAKPKGVLNTVKSWLGW